MRRKKKAAPTMLTVESLALRWGMTDLNTVAAIAHSIPVVYEVTNDVWDTYQPLVRRYSGSYPLSAIVSFEERLLAEAKQHALGAVIAQYAKSLKKGAAS